MSPSTIAVISDIHDETGADWPDARRTLLERAVHRLNRFIKPDVTVILGDLVDNPKEADTHDRLRRLKETLDLLHSPYVVVPGSRDPKADVFYTVFDRPQPFVDCGRLRLVPFFERMRAGAPMDRPAKEIERLKRARSGHDGPIVTLQHIAPKPPGEPLTASLYANAEEIVRACEEAGVALSIGGHYHRTKGIEREGRSAYLTVRAMKDAPFTFTVVRIDDSDRIEVTEHPLQMPRSLDLVDIHTHSEFAYCAKGMKMSLTPRIAEFFGLAGVALTEHSGQLYFGRESYWSGEFCEEGIATPHGRDERIAAYWECVDREWDGSLWAGLEIDSDYHGRLVVLPEDFRRAQVRNGAVHYLRELKKRQHADPEKVADEFMRATEGIVRSGIDVLAHPFRVFRRAGLLVPDRLFEPVARMLAEYGVAAEINFHTNEPDPRFFALCLRLGVKVAFGSDAHSPWEVGEFAPHLQLLRDCGFDGDVCDVVWTPPTARIQKERRQVRL